ncbi:MAG: Iron(3+)-hydroxamate import system permease protein FhuB [Stenotrophomonas maltophilia]|nr:MAG: Iron(3+)-hydroxamate import system permease protein FhuB [Stenotrophomonas maltophilia]
MNPAWSLPAPWRLRWPLALLGLLLIGGGLSLANALPLLRAVAGADGLQRQLHWVLFYDGWLPRLLMAWLCGALLGLAGLLFQQVLRNPLAEPMTLGVSSAAQLALTLASLWAPGLAALPVAVAIVGALLAGLLVFGLTWRSGLAPLKVAVAGLLVSLCCGSLSVTLQVLYAPYLRGLFIWGGGSLVQQDWSGVGQLLPVLLLGLPLAAVLLRPLGLFELHDSHARGLGLNLHAVRLATLGLALLISAWVVGVVGVIGFIGLAAPAVVRLAGIRRLSQRLLAAPLCGALLLWLCDQWVQRWAGAFGDLLPTGALTALLGTPLLLPLLARGATRSTLPGPAARLGTRIAPAAARKALLLTSVALVLALGLSLALGHDNQGWHLSDWLQTQHLLVWRGPRALAALACGALLAMAGVVLQRLTGNPLASPDLLGVSSGAALGLVLVLYALPQAGSLPRLLGATLGALAALLAMLAFARRAGHSLERVLLAGVAIGALCQAALNVATAQGGEQAVQLLAWLSGSTYAIDARDAACALALALVLAALAPFGQRWLLLLPLGAVPTRALGVPGARATRILLGLAALACAASTLLVGPLSFVGLSAPHLARLLGARRPLAQLALAALLGALLMVLADLLGRTLVAPRELPAGLLACLLGSPYLLWLIARR